MYLKCDENEINQSMNQSYSLFKSLHKMTHRSSNYAGVLFLFLKHFCTKLHMKFRSDP